MHKKINRDVNLKDSCNGSLNQSIFTFEGQEMHECARTVHFLVKSNFFFIHSLRESTMNSIKTENIFSFYKEKACQ